ncbi:MAG: acyl transferase [Chitinophagales bacterium]|nr:acyl transferase [Chitinophagales bacterium]
MLDLNSWKQRLSDMDGGQMEAMALEAFHYQVGHNQVYQQYVSLLGRKAKSVSALEEIPFLPIDLFRGHSIITGNNGPQAVFKSSATTGQARSHHYVLDVGLYEWSFTQHFTAQFGPPSEWIILALLPNYLQQGDSSLVYMVKQLIEMTGQSDSGFYLNNLGELAEKLGHYAQTNQKVMLIGVSFALLELAERFSQPLHNIKMMETGGMKGRRKELTRRELHQSLCQAFQIPKIYSEYGMTELLSQAYTDGSDYFAPPPWMRAMARDIYDPFTILEDGKTGALNIIDLANIHSCCFIATDDIGSTYPDNRFTVLGRMDFSAIRGCNLMVQD